MTSSSSPARGAISDYQFGPRRIHHFFCSTCGIGAFSRGGGQDGRGMYAVNVRCLEGVDPHALSVKRVDGKRL